ncbi:MAG: hypothetical protein II480_14025 [Bacteroidales bacterium]|nr:hypothetical protein [Bacteroidales bacterium]
MKKFTILFAGLMILMACVVVSCGGGKSDDNNNEEPEGPTAKYLTADQFAKTSGKGEKNGKDLTLDVTSKTSMTLKYYEKTAVSKHTDPDPTEAFKEVTVTITYSFDAAKGVATGSANNVAYVATLTAKDKMDFTMGSENLKLTKK